MLPGSRNNPGYLKGSGKMKNRTQILLFGAFALFAVPVWANGSHNDGHGDGDCDGGGRNCNAVKVSVSVCTGFDSAFKCISYQPAADEWVELFYSTSPNGWRYAQTGATGTQDPTGNSQVGTYTFSGLAPGVSYNFCVWAPGPSVAGTTVQLYPIAAGNTNDPAITVVSAPGVSQQQAFYAGPYCYQYTVPYSCGGQHLVRFLIFIPE